jgi:hypothetical protein
LLNCNFLLLLHLLKFLNYSNNPREIRDMPY